MPMVETRAGALAYEESGAGPVVVLLHANLHDHHDFDPIVPALQDSFRVVAVDWPGCGNSPSASAPELLSAPMFADALEDLADQIDAPTIVLIGNSVGGFAAARFAITRPDRVAGLILVNNGGFIPMNPLLRTFCKLMGTPAVTRLILPAFARSYMKPQSEADRQILTKVIGRAKTRDGIQAAAALWRSFATDDHDLRDLADQVKAPTLIVWGSRDTAIPSRAGRATHAAIPGSRFETLPTGHVPFASAPDEFLALALPFLRFSRGVVPE